MGKKITICGLERRQSIPNVTPERDEKLSFYGVLLSPPKENIYIHDISASRCI